MNQEILDQKHAEMMWQHKENCISHFFNFANFFLVSQSILLAAYSTIYSKQEAPETIVITIILIGLVLSILWLYILSKQKYIIDLLKDTCETKLPEYRLHREMRKKSKIFIFSNSGLFAYFLPCLFLLVWAIVAYIAIKF